LIRLRHTLLDDRLGHCFPETGLIPAGIQERAPTARDFSKGGFMKRLLMLVLAALALPAAAFAVITPGGSTTIANGQATLVSDNSAHPYSYVNFSDLNGQPVSNLTSLSADLASATGWGGGAPRFSVEVSNGTPDTRNIQVYLGTAPNFTDGTTGPTGNLLASPDLRVDTSQIGGTFYDTWQNGAEGCPGWWLHHDHRHLAGG
jgi:hypothetical protein